MSDPQPPLIHGVPLEVVSENLGRSSIAITGDVHAHVAPDVSRGAMDVLSAALGEQEWPHGGRPPLDSLTCRFALSG